MQDRTSIDSDRTRELLARFDGGDRQALDALLDEHRPRLRRMVEVRMAAKLRARADASDVVQEAFFDASRRLPKYLEERPMPFFLWLRFLTRQKLTDLHRHHFCAQMRDAGREIAIEAPASGEILAAGLVDSVSSPSHVVARGEMENVVTGLLNDLTVEECEILALRHFEQLSNVEAAAELGLGESAASKRYIRALVRLRELLDRHGLSFTGF